MDFNKPFEDNKNTAGETLTFETQCHNCGHEGETRMCTCSIPYFKEIIVMSFTCNQCGARSTEVKTGGGISDKARKTTIRVNKVEDLNRDIFKSESAEVSINELGLTIVSGSLGGVYSTVEGLMEKVLETLKGDNPFVGDSSDTEFMGRFNGFLEKLQAFKEGTKPFTLILDDPLDNCFIQNPFYPEEDPQVETLVYERTEEQNDEFGITQLIADQLAEKEAENKNEQS